ncbi:carboxypeptidase regulatory-like domain-containing protein [Mucilaginibacter sp.]|uniref:carboxypeptidase regulatory-like domain-containing protein n=1 Tax=Mucilaginibacter sp. TaxID=1882438 RepID=UPI0032638940
MKVIRCLFFFLPVWYVSAAFAQTDTAFINRANTFVERQPPTEKVYLHLDKPAYNFADTIWFKAYTVIGQHHQLSALSGVLYVEIISPNDTLVSRQTLKLTSGIASNGIALDAGLPQGIYRLRAYTKWMRNAGAAYFYEQKIRIGGIPPPVTAAIKPIAQKPDVQFFPEGGEMVNGLRSRIAIKAINSEGLGENIQGTIEDNDGNIVADFATRHLGMGVFALIPKSDKTYRAKIGSPGETLYTVDLPIAKTIGYTLAINNSQADSIFIKVAVNHEFLKEGQGNTFYVLAQSAGKIYYSAQGKLTGQVYMAGISRSRFPSGIVQFTLFNQNSQPVAERVAFIRGSDSLTMQVTPQTKTFQARQPVKFNLVAKGSSRQATGTFSISVTNETAVGLDESLESTIVNSLLLTSDLKGSIEQPNYYFTGSTQASADLDLLMLTQGYRKFKWKQALGAEPGVPVYQPESSLELSGTVQTMAGKPVPNGKVVLTATRGNLITDTLTDANGNFKFVNLDMADTSKVTLNAKKSNNNNNVQITVLNPGYAEILKSAGSDTTTSVLPPQITAVLQQKYSGYQQLQKEELIKRGRILKEVRIKANRIRKAPELTYSANLNGPGHANQVIMGDDLNMNSCPYVSGCLIGKVMGVKFNAQGEPINTRSVGMNTLEKPMVLIVDGIMMEGSHLNELNSNDIYSIEVLRSLSYLTIYGSNAATGALVITMRRGGESRAKQTSFSGVITYLFKGFTPTRSFYTPKYSAATPLPDLRSTIYWNPNVITDKDGLATIEYLNNDNKGTYRVVIEGIDDNGNLGRSVYRYKVE